MLLHFSAPWFFLTIYHITTETLSSCYNLLYPTLGLVGNHTTIYRNGNDDAQTGRGLWMCRLDRLSGKLCWIQSLGWSGSSTDQRVGGLTSDSSSPHVWASVATKLSPRSPLTTVCEGRVIEKRCIYDLYQRCTSFAAYSVQHWSVCQAFNSPFVTQWQ